MTEAGVTSEVLRGAPTRCSGAFVNRSVRNPGFSFNSAKKLASRVRLASWASSARVPRKGRGSEIHDALRGIRIALRSMNQAEGIDSLRGFEGEAGRLYFSAFRRC